MRLSPNPNTLSILKLFTEPEISLKLSGNPLSSGCVGAMSSSSSSSSLSPSSSESLCNIIYTTIKIIYNHELSLITGLNVLGMKIQSDITYIRIICLKISVLA